MSDNHDTELRAWADLCVKEQAQNKLLEAENAYLRERHAEAVAQLPATIEVLEWFALNVEFDNPLSVADWYVRQCEPHLEHLKALAKEAEV